MCNEDIIYNDAINCVNNLVEEVIQRCEQVADENDYGIDWILNQFRVAYNKKLKELNK